MDVYGKALLDYYKYGTAETLLLYNSYAGTEEMPIDLFFREADEMPELEHKALDLCYGKIIDIGAGVGSHALILQEKGFDITAIDVSEKAVAIMKDRGIKKAFVKDVMLLTERYDTLLFLMNGIGLTGTLIEFEKFLIKVKSFINPNGQLIFDSSDISYLYEDTLKPKDKYFGEIGYCYKYKREKGNWFKWLYIDQETLIRLAKLNGWNCEIIFEDGEDQYLVRLTLIG